MLKEWKAALKFSIYLHPIVVSFTFDKLVKSVDCPATPFYLKRGLRDLIGLLELECKTFVILKSTELLKPV